VTAHYVLLGSLVVLVLANLFSQALMVRSVGRIDASLRKIHLQQANIIAMLLRAGFRPARTLDWRDDGDRTMHPESPALTRFDWRNPV
jgi:hypothetical protein